VDSARAAMMRVAVCVEAMVALAIGTVLRRLVSLRRLGPLLGDVGPVGGPSVARPGDAEAIGQVRWALAVTTRRLSWEPACVAEALAAALMLRRRGVGYRVVVGVRRSDGGDGPGMAAHAWVDAGDVVVAGRAGHEAFEPLHVYRRSAR
jgi:hypothetical protein